MKTKLLTLVAAFVLLAPAAVGQTIYQEGRGLFLEATALNVSLPYATGIYTAAGDITYRLSRHLDVGAGMTYYSTSFYNAYGIGASVGYTAKLFDTGWGLRPSLSAGRMIFSGRIDRSFSSLSAGIGLFRELRLGRLLAVPQVNVAPLLLMADDVATELNSHVAVPLYLRVWQNAHVMVTPSYGVSLLPDFRTSDAVGISLGVQFSF